MASPIGDAGSIGCSGARVGAMATEIARARPIFSRIGTDRLPSTGSAEM